MPCARTHHRNDDVLGLDRGAVSATATTARSRAGLTPTPLHLPTPRDQIEHDHDERDNQQQVNQSAEGRAREEPESPEDDQNHNNPPQHGACSLREVSSSHTTAHSPIPSAGSENPIQAGQPAQPARPGRDSQTSPPERGSDQAKTGQAMNRGAAFLSELPSAAEGRFDRARTPCSAGHLPTHHTHRCRVQAQMPLLLIGSESRPAVWQYALTTDTLRLISAFVGFGFPLSLRTFLITSDF